MNKVSWTIREPLGVAWPEELVWLDLPEGCRDGRTFRSVSDGQRAIGAQYDPSRNALAACVSLEPQQQLTLTAETREADESPLAVQHVAGAHVLRNARCAIALADQPVVLDEGDRWVLTGPIRHVVGPDALPRCGSRLVIHKSRFFDYDRRSIIRANPRAEALDRTPPQVQARIEEAGPVFARYAYEVRMADGRYYRFAATLYAAFPYVLIEETADLDRDGGLEVSISENFGCDEYFFGPVEGPRPTSQVPLPPHPYRIGSLAPHHTQGHLAYPWLGFCQSRRPQSDFRGICDTELEPFDDTLVFMPHKPWDWQYPGEVTMQFECLEGRRALATGAVRRGSRSWCLFITPRAEMEKLHRYQAWEPNEISRFALWHRKINDMPLDWIRRLDLASGRPDASGPPRSLLTAQEWGARKGVRGEIADLVRQRLAKDNAPSSLLARWLLLEDREAAVQLASCVESFCEVSVAIFLTAGFLPDAVCAVRLRQAGPCAVYYEACLAAGVLSEAKAARLQTLLLLMAHATASDALFPSHHNYPAPDHPKSIRNWAIAENYSTVFGTPNFQTDVYYNLGLFGAVFREHPLSRTWMTEAAAQMDQQLDAHFHPGGVYAESIGYFAHMFHNLLSLASVLRRQGGRDFFADARFQNAMECFVDYLGAPRRASEGEQRPGGQADEAALERFWPAIGDTGHNSQEAHLQPLAVHAAWEVREHNPRLSDKLLAAWDACGRPLWGDYEPRFDYLYTQDLRAAHAPLELTSRYFHGSGAMLRADVGLPSETSLFFRSGRGTHHWGYEHGHFTLTTRGAVVLPDFGYFGPEAPGGKTIHGYHTWLHNVVTFGPHDNGNLGVEYRGEERAIRLGDDFDYVVADLSLNNVRQVNWRNAKTIIPVEYFRHLLFAHNRYVFVWDRIERSVYDSQLRVHTLSSRVDFDGPRMRFAGPGDVNLVVHMVQPGETEFTEGLIGRQRYVLCRQSCERDYIWLCQPLGRGEQEFAVSRGPNRVTISGTDLHGKAFEDHLVYAKGGFGATVEIAGRPWRLDGRLALIHTEGGKESIQLLDAQSFGA